MRPTLETNMIETFLTESSSRTSFKGSRSSTAWTPMRISRDSVGKVNSMRNYMSTARNNMINRMNAAKRYMSRRKDTLRICMKRKEMIRMNWGPHRPVNRGGER